VGVLGRGLEEARPNRARRMLTDQNGAFTSLYARDGMSGNSGGQELRSQFGGVERGELRCAHPWVRNQTERLWLAWEEKVDWRA
jgi:hypothetical protein